LTDVIAFLDFEASSLSKHSYPIEIAWVFENAHSRSFLIRPEPNWIDWSPDAEKIHGISRDELSHQGSPVVEVTREIMNALSGHDLYASSPSWDGKWLSVLLRGGGLPRHALRLRKSDDLFAAVASDILFNAGVKDINVDAFVADIIARTETTAPAHRALPDARLELERLRLVQRASEAMAGTAVLNSTET